MRKSPEWELHVCLKVLWLDPFPDIFLLGCCTGVSDKHRSAPLPSDAGHQSVAPVLAPPSLSAQSVCMNLHKHINGESRVWHSSQSWTNTQSYLNVPSVLGRYYSSGLYISLDLNTMTHVRDSDCLSPESFHRFCSPNIIFWTARTGKKNDSCRDCEA